MVHDTAPVHGKPTGSGEGDVGRQVLVHAAEPRSHPAKRPTVGKPGIRKPETLHRLPGRVLAGRRMHAVEERHLVDAAGQMRQCAGDPAAGLAVLSPSPGTLGERALASAMVPPVTRKFTCWPWRRMSSRACSRTYRTAAGADHEELDDRLGRGHDRGGRSSGGELVAIEQPKARATGGRSCRAGCWMNFAARQGERCRS